MKITINDIKKAQETIRPIIKRTQLGFSRSSTERICTEIYLKSENEQITGSFKLRGACNKILSLSDREKDQGVIAASAGNHAQGVAYAASMAGVPSIVVMPESAPFVKVDATEGYGATVVLHGQGYDDSYEYAKTLSEEKGYTFVHPFDDPMVIAGQGTIALEILEDLPDVDSVVVGVGGGGLAAGVGLAIKSLRPECRVYGVQPDHFAGMVDLYHGKSARVAGRNPTIADGTAIRHPSTSMFQNYLSQVLDGMVAVTESEIAQAIVFLLERAKTVVEGSGALCFAGALKGDWDLGQKCCLLLCGGNIDMNQVAKVLDKGLEKDGRLVRLNMRVSDRPGELHQLTKVIAEHRANVLEVHHDRMGVNLDVRETQVNILLETRNHYHIEEIVAALKKEGVRF